MTSTYIDPRNASYFWSRLSPTQQQALRAAFASKGVVPFGASVATVRALRRNGYVDFDGKDQRLTRDGVTLVRYARAAVAVKP